MILFRKWHNKRVSHKLIWHYFIFFSFFGWSLFLSLMEIEACKRERNAHKNKHKCIFVGVEEKLSWSLCECKNEPKIYLFGMFAPYMMMMLYVSLNAWFSFCFCYFFLYSSCLWEHVIIIHPSKRHWKLFIHENNDVKGKRIIVTWLLYKQTAEWRREENRNVIITSPHHLKAAKEREKNVCQIKFH